MPELVVGWLKKPQDRFTSPEKQNDSLETTSAESIVKTIEDIEAFSSGKQMTKLIKKSPKRQAIFKKIQHEITWESPGIRMLAPTRWDCFAAKFKVEIKRIHLSGTNTCTHFTIFALLNSNIPCIP